MNISQETIETIKARMNEEGLSRTALARELGISLHSLYKYIRKFGGRLDYHRNQKQEGVEDMIREYYPHFTASEISKMKPNGIILSSSKVTEWAHRLGVKHTEETNQRIKGKQLTNARLMHTKDAEERATASWKRTRRLECLRQDIGAPRQTKLKIKKMPSPHYKAAWCLEKKYGYIITTDPYVIWYDENTRRVSTEPMYEQKYGFTFEQAND